MNRSRSLLFAAVCGCLQLAAQPGVLDPGFGDGGRVSIGDLNVKGLLLQPDQRIVLIGSRLVIDNDIVLMRLLPDGSVDSTFGTNGTVVHDLAWSNDRVSGCALQADGKILVAGISLHPYVARFDADGAVDAAFGTAGHAFMDHPVVNGEEHWQVGVRPDGRILLAGTDWTDPNDEDLLVFRLLTDGALDTGFASSGELRVHAGAEDLLMDMVVLPDGGFALLGRSWYTWPDPNVEAWCVRLVKCFADGSIDSGFGGPGGTFARPSAAGVFVRPTSLIVRPDGRMIVSGLNEVVDHVGVFPFAMRFLQDGIADPAFGSEGTVELPGFPVHPDMPLSMALGDDGRLVLSASDRTGFSDTLNTLVLGFDAYGALDPWFGDAGAVLLDLGVISDAAQAIRIQADGKILSVSMNHGENFCEVVRLGAQGPIGIVESDPGPGFRASPNPTDGVVRLKGVTGPGTLRIVDAAGRVLAEHMMTSEVDLSFLPVGTYVLELRNADGVRRGRVVKH